MTMAISLNIPKPQKVFTRQILDHLTDYSHPVEIWYGGASSGKSHGVVQKMVLKACKPWKFPRRMLFLRKVARTVKRSIFQDVLDCLSNFQLLAYCKVNLSDFEIKLPNGAQFLFAGMDDPEKIKSIKGVSDVIMEEATEFTPEDFMQLRIRLREAKHLQRQLVLMFNPVSKANWVFTNFFVKEPPKGTVIYQSTYKDNQFLDQATRDTIEELARTNPAYYRIYALGEFATLDKLIFPRYEKRVIDREQLRRIPDFYGLDFGYANDPSVLIHVKLDLQKQRLYILDEYSKPGMLNNEIAQVIKSMGYAKEVITADAAEQKSIAEIRLRGVSRIRASHKGKDSILQGIQFMQQFQLIVDEHCPKTIEELENYTWQKDKKTGEYVNKPVDSFNHCIDAIRYAIENSMRKRMDIDKTLRILNKYGLGR
ncbi:terminase [Loigolactobacillus coryniformis subsp. torquens DSM 20004 = KCTC 3535]|uniref:Terminase n=2 Tax=Loigolactobacillus coryniformis TaxID=1610 RepID=A0A2D1KMH8_9LACO|nr:PBSX family phage terminase large subunit [Loigolactobacillus coryniformis]ATO43318.1 terminase [Loigolactobacillus coryniformis subsp. torquens DSM 20004 = KCTC 3535]